MDHEQLRYAHDNGHTDVCFSNDGQKFITCGSDGDLRIWSVNDDQDPVHNCIGEWALCVRHCNDKLYVATGNNDVQILTYPSGERNGVLDRFVAPINHIACDKSGNVIVLAGEDMEVKLYSFNGSSMQAVIFDGLSGPCLSVALCPKSLYVAASCGDSTLRIWNIKERKVIKRFENCFPKVTSFATATVLSRIDFDPKYGMILAYPHYERNAICIVDVEIWSEKTHLKVPNNNSPFSIVQFSPCSKYLVATTVTANIVIWTTNNWSILTQSKHPKSIRICGLMWNPSQTGQLTYTDCEGELGFANITNSTQNNPEELVKPTNYMEEFEEVEENAISLGAIKKQFNGSDSDNDEDSISVKSGSRIVSRLCKVQMQEPFMPSSTPLHLSPRYLCWNHIGIIRAYGSDTDEKTIEVEFHDTNFHNSIVVHNYHNYTMGTISETALMLANSTQISVLPLQGGTKEWLLNLSQDHEEIQLISCSENLIVFITNHYLLRICSIYGTQRACLTTPGPLVSLNSYKTMILLAYHSSFPRDYDQCIRFKLYEMMTCFRVKCLRDFDQGLRPNSTLFWLGFTDQGTPAIMDSEGVVNLIKDVLWLPFCDTTKHRKNPSDSFFVTTIFESQQIVCGIHCRGGIYPSFTPRPTLAEIPLGPLFAECGTEKTQLEAALFSWENLQVEQSTDKRFKEYTLKTFALACKNDLEARALEFIQLISNSQVLSLAIKYASKLDKRRLVEKLRSLCEDIVEEDIKETPKNVKPVPLRINSNREPVTTVPETSRPELMNSIVNTQESLFSQELSAAVGVKNPFITTFNGTLNQSKETSQFSVNNSPLSLTDQIAGIQYDLDAEKCNRNKRRFSNNDENTPSGKTECKQRKMDLFTSGKFV